MNFKIFFPFFKIFNDSELELKASFDLKSFLSNDLFELVVSSERSSRIMKKLTKKLKNSISFGQIDINRTGSNFSFALNSGVSLYYWMGYASHFYNSLFKRNYQF
jgi:hypothetical protein